MKRYIAVHTVSGIMQTRNMGQSPTSGRPAP